jgi:prepilin-type N-terminal cleavage/methylation domain-containing protein
LEKISFFQRFLRLKKAFTLVELIVVITILAILGTIAFLSFQSYLSSSRDSTRVSDVRSMMLSLETTRIKNGAYPEPDDFFSVEFSGSTVWNQGVF